MHYNLFLYNLKSTFYVNFMSAKLIALFVSFYVILHVCLTHAT